MASHEGDARTGDAARRAGVFLVVGERQGAVADGLRLRGVRVCQVRDGAAAMVALARTGMDSEFCVGTVIVESGAVGRALREAVMAYHPGVRVQSFDATRGLLVDPDGKPMALPAHQIKPSNPESPAVVLGVVPVKVEPEPAFESAVKPQRHTIWHDLIMRVRPASLAKTREVRSVPASRMSPERPNRSCDRVIPDGPLVSEAELAMLLDEDFQGG